MVPDRETLAATIHKARWPTDRTLAATPFADEDDNGRNYCFRIADAVLKLLEPAPLAWDANENRSYGPVETLAAEIYAAFPYVSDYGAPLPGDKPKWTPHGNGIMQEKARSEARQRLRDSGHAPKRSL